MCAKYQQNSMYSVGRSHVHALYPFDLCRFSADFVVCVTGNMVPEYGEPYLASNSEVYSKIN